MPGRCTRPHLFVLIVARLCRSKLILFITLADIAFASKYSLSAAAFLLGAQAPNSSFGLLPDGCGVAAAWGQFWAMASASWNVRGGR